MVVETVSVMTVETTEPEVAITMTAITETTEPEVAITMTAITETTEAIIREPIFSP